MIFCALLMRRQFDAVCRMNTLEHLRELNSTPSVGVHDVPRESLLDHLGFAALGRRAIHRTNWMNG